MKIISLSMGAHDSSYAIFENQELIIHEELERINRIKETDADIVQYLEDSNISLDDFDYVLTYKHGEAKWYSPKYLEYKSKNIHKCFEIGHHLAHAANAYYSTDINDATVVIIDGGGWEEIPISNSVWSVHENKFNLLKSSFDVNIGGIWSNVTSKIFGLCGGGPPFGCQAGTVMAMSCMGKHNPNINLFNLPNENILTQQEKYDYAYELQQFTETFITNYISDIIKNSSTKNLCLAGGVVLNCVYTGKLKKLFPELEFIYIPPAPYDAGLAIGCAQYFLFSVLGLKRVKTGLYNSPYLGKLYSDEDIKKSISQYQNINVKDSSIEEVVKLLTEKNIISVFNERSESGRRALGNRSILADPRHSDMKDKINEKIKHREWFRPFAPAILKENMSEWFEFEIDSPYMSFAIPFKEEKKKLVPAVVHLDGTGRLQTVEKNRNNFFYSLISEFNKQTNIPIVLNTSFNDKEPIVETPSDAINCFLKTNLDFLYFSQTKQLISKK